MTNAEAHPRASLPALLRHARATYGAAMRIALARTGHDDIPESGLYLIGRLAQAGEGVPIGRLVDALGITKQGAGQLVDTLVTRGYMTRTPSQADRRQLIVTLTDRGRAAAAALTKARKTIDAELADVVPEADIESTRRTLAALIEIGNRSVNIPTTQEKTLMTDTERFQDRRLDDAVFDNCSMVRSRFEDLNLSESVFEDVNLRGARFRNVNLTSVSIKDAKLDDVVFENCPMVRSRFEDLNLSEAVFEDVNLRGTRCNNVNLTSVSIEDANIDGLTIFGHDISKLIRDHEALLDRKNA
jgi:uncharacterized protein YjbI with pentapeptide repeats